MKNGLRQTLTLRQQTSAAIRKFLGGRGYLEADVPVLAPALIPESYLEAFETTLHKEDGSAKAYLTASPEAFLKRLLTKFPHNLFYLGKAFRNSEPTGKMHNHEFTILEWYSVGTDYRGLMKEIEQMVGFIAKELSVDIGVDFAPPWEYLTLEEAFQKYVPSALPERLDRPLLEPSELFEKHYVQYIEPKLGAQGKPTFVTDFPVWQSPLAKVNPDNPQAAERFELYIKGVELVNGWTELTDAAKQKENFENEIGFRKVMGKKEYLPDWDFIKALEKGMPTCSGAAMGVDRLMMVLGGYQSLKDVILFPTSSLF